MKANIAKRVILLLILITSAETWACSCEVEWTIEKSVENIPIILSGRILTKIVTHNYDSLGIKAVDSASSNPWFNKRNVFYKIKVDKMLKGKLLSDTITIITGQGSSAYEAKFRVGAKYIIYACFDGDYIYTKGSKSGQSDTKTLWTNTCLRNTPWYELAHEEEDYIINLVKKLK